jgi:hypothetical protein
VKKVKLLSLVLSACLLISFQQAALAQGKDTTKNYRNTVRFNISNAVFFNRAYVFGYEFLISKSQSFSFNFGTTGFPTLNLVGSDSLKVRSNVGGKGYNFSVDYRFYLAKENKYIAPRGIYIGPYYSYNYFEKNNSWTVKTKAGTTVDVESDLKLDIHTVGVELGYQFVFWNRVALDLILLGPGVSLYSLNAKLGSNLSPEDQQKFYKALNDALATKFPGYDVIIDDGEFKTNGSSKTTSLGYRYMINIGFRF